MNNAQRRNIIEIVKQATGRTVTNASVQRVLQGDITESHPVDMALAAAVREVRSKRKK